MTRSVTCAPPNGFVAIAESLETADLPANYPTDSWVASTTSCIYVSCDSVDDATTFTIGPERDVAVSELICLFDGVIKTPQKRVCVWTTEWKKLLDEAAPSERTRVRIWGNRPKFPDKVVIGLAAPS